MLDKNDIIAALKTIKYPGYSRDIVSFGLVDNISINNALVSVSLKMTSANADIATELKHACEEKLQNLSDVEKVQIYIQQPGDAPSAAAQDPWANQQRIPNVDKVLAVASGKGGVGKTTCSVNLACALAHLGAKVGLLDCDIYGPTVPLMMGINQRPMVDDHEKIIPPSNFKIKIMSMGFLLEKDTPVIWRGPMIMKIIQQFTLQVDWGKLDYLIVDLPPGTGDAQLSLCQTVPLDGGIIVTTPQVASLEVVRKGISMFTQINVPLVGIIENMSYFVAPSGERVEIFGHGGGRQEAQRQNIPFLGDIPIYTEIREAGDKGAPLVVSASDSPPAQTIIAIAKKLQDTFQCHSH
jgi:ATP-binding protein involved in chromosome partitioning